RRLGGCAVARARRVDGSVGVRGDGRGVTGDPPSGTGRRGEDDGAVAPARVASGRQRGDAHVTTPSPHPSSSHPLVAVADLPGVADAVAEARETVDRLLG